MEVFTWARIPHVLGVIIWIGGVAMVTLVIIPAVKNLKNSEEQISTFEKIEGRFSTFVLSPVTIIGAVAGSHGLYFF